MSRLDFQMSDISERKAIFGLTALAIAIILSLGAVALAFL
jgi:hypothetical protein